MHTLHDFSTCARRMSLARNCKYSTQLSFKPFTQPIYDLASLSTNPDFFYLPKQRLQTGSEFMYEKLERSGNSDEHL